MFCGCALFGPSCQKRDILDTHQTKRKIWLIIEKFFFGICVFFCFSFFVFLGALFCFSFFGWGFKGQVKWPAHLAQNPPFYYFFWGGFVFSFPLSAFYAKIVCSPRKGHFCLFLSLSLCFSLPFFGLPLFNFSFSVSLLFFSFFLPSCLSFLLSFGSFFLSLSFLLFFFAFVSCKEQHQNIQLQFVSSIVSLLFGFLSCFSFESLFLMFVFFSWI